MIVVAGPVVLMGESFASGLLQIYNDEDRQWFGVCADSFDQIDGNIACHQMGLGDLDSSNYSLKSLIM